LLMFALALAVVPGCGGAQPAKINTQQDYENAVVGLVQKVIDIFKADGMNCDVLQHDLHNVTESQQYGAVKEWGDAHADAKPAVRPKLEPYKGQFQEAATPAMRQCGPQIAKAFANLAQ